MKLLAAWNSRTPELVLPDRIELSTSPLPRECSTTELRQQTGGARWRVANGVPRLLPQPGRARKARAAEFAALG